MAWRGEHTGARAPNQAAGYDRSALHLGGMGSGMGTTASPLAQGTGATAGAAGWHPTILYLFVLIIAEMVAFGMISRLLQ